LQGDLKKTLRVERQEADWQTVQRGTIQHEIFSGDKPPPYLEGSNLSLQVNCREQASGLIETVRYALAVTLEAENTAIDLPIYEQVLERLRTKIGIHP